MPTKPRILAGVLMLSTALLAAAPTRPPQEKGAAFAGNRYLLIVENSASMEKRDEGLRQTVFDVVNTGLRGRMESGDTFGIWTFNVTVDNRFPMQVWEGASRLDLGTRVNTFLRNQGYHKRGRLDAVMIDVSAVGESVGELTVVLFTDGNDRMEGTPFDREINALYRQLSSPVAKQKLPLLTGLTIRGGQYVAYSVVAAGDPLTLPPPPERLRPKQSPASRNPRTAVAIATNAPARRVAPIIMSKDGKDPEADRDLASNPPDAAVPAPVPQTGAHPTRSTVASAPLASTNSQAAPNKQAASPAESTTRAVASNNPTPAPSQTGTASTNKPAPAASTAVGVSEETSPTSPPRSSLLPSSAAKAPTPPQPLASAPPTAAAPASPSPAASRPGDAFAQPSAPIASLRGFTLEQLTQAMSFATESAQRGNRVSGPGSSAGPGAPPPVLTDPPSPLVGAKPMLPTPASSITAHARENRSETLGSVHSPALGGGVHPRSTALLGGAVLMFLGSALGIWACWRRARKKSEGSYISRAMPRAGDGGTPAGRRSSR
ncbi:MAG: hypothetical protein HYR88_00045 [Verrucomicrobia bacterium]|nr:hypothetical protein [Verrucomicrobiota bacterium]